MKAFGCLAHPRVRDRCSARYSTPCSHWIVSITRLMETSFWLLKIAWDDVNLIWISNNAHVLVLYVHNTFFFSLSWLKSIIIWQQAFLFSDFGQLKACGVDGIWTYGLLSLDKQLDKQLDRQLDRQLCQSMKCCETMYISVSKNIYRTERLI